MTELEWGKYLIDLEKPYIRIFWPETSSWWRASNGLMLLGSGKFGLCVLSCLEDSFAWSHAFTAYLPSYFTRFHYQRFHCWNFSLITLVYPTVVVRLANVAKLHILLLNNSCFIHVFLPPSCPHPGTYYREKKKFGHWGSMESWDFYSILMSGNK